MKKIYAFFAAALMSATLFAEPTTVPGVEDLAAKYDVGSYVVLCCYFDTTPCNPIVLTGQYGNVNWSNDISQLVAMEPVVGFDGWYAGQVPIETGKEVILRPVQLVEGPEKEGKKTYNFEWEYGAAGPAYDTLPDAWTHLGGKEASEIAGSPYGDEASAKFTEPGAYIYEVSRWRDNNNPCVELVMHNYTLILLPPTCEKNEEYIVPAIAGKPINNWDGFQELDLVEYEGKEAYGIVLNAAEGWEFKFSDMTFGYDNEYQWKKAEDDSWQDWPNFKFPVVLDDTTLVFDWSDNDSNRYKLCDVDVYEVTVNAVLPAGAPEAGVEIMGTFVEGKQWKAALLCDHDAEENIYSVTIRAIESSVFKFRELGTWLNEILYFDGAEWTTDYSLQVGEYWFKDPESLTATLDLDLTPEEGEEPEYKWKVSGEEGIENIVLTEKANKVVVDGQIYIIRDNKLFNIHGAQLR